MVDLISSCRISRRESICKRCNFLPNENLEGMIKNTGKIHFYKNGIPRLKFNYGMKRYIFVTIPKSGASLSVAKGDYEFSFMVPGFKYPFVVETGVDRNSSFNCVLSSFNLSQVPLLTRGKNFTLRTLTPTLIDGLMMD